MSRVRRPQEETQARTRQESLIVLVEFATRSCATKFKNTKSSCSLSVQRMTRPFFAAVRDLRAQIETEKLRSETPATRAVATWTCSSPSTRSRAVFVSRRRPRSRRQPRSVDWQSVALDRLPGICDSLLVPDLAASDGARHEHQLHGGRHLPKSLLVRPLVNNHSVLYSILLPVWWARQRQT